MSTELMDQDNSAPVVRGQATAIEQKKAEAATLIQSSFLIAKRFPRDSNASYARIIESCKRYSLAKASTYSYPRGGENVTGPSIRLAEVLAQQWGNIKYGFHELENEGGKSVVEAFCHDLETNTLVSRTFTVKHEITLKNKSKKHLTDSRDVYELVANMAQRRVRAAILEVIPGDITEAALKECRKTFAAGDGEPLADRVRRAVLAFKDLGVSLEMLEKRMGHKLDLTTGEEIVDLQAVYNAIKDKASKRGDFFDFPDDQQREETDAKAASLSDRLRSGSSSQKTKERQPGEDD